MRLHFTLLLPPQAPWAQMEGSATSSPEAWTAVRSCAADEATTPCLSNVSPAVTASSSGAAPWSAKFAKMLWMSTSASPACDRSRSCQGDLDKSQQGWLSNRCSPCLGYVASSILVFDACLILKSRDTWKFHPETLLCAHGAALKNIFVEQVSNILYKPIICLREWIECFYFTERLSVSKRDFKVTI